MNHVTRLETGNPEIVKHFLRNILSVLKTMFKVKVTCDSPAYFTVHSTGKELTERIINYVNSEYDSRRIGYMVDGNLIHVSRVKVTASAASSASDDERLRKRHTLSDGGTYYEFITGETIHRENNRPVKGSDTWIIKDKNGNVLQKSNTLREAWFYLEANYKG